MYTLARKMICVILSITFIAGQAVAAPVTSTAAHDAVGLPLASDSDIGGLQTNTQSNIAGTCKPGAIGNGAPLVDLLTGKMPPPLSLSTADQESLRARIGEAIEIALKSCVAPKAPVPAGQVKTLDAARAEMVALWFGLSARLHPFNATVDGPEDYLVGFHSTGLKTGLAIDFVEWLYAQYDEETATKRLAQYIFHECCPEKLILKQNVVDREAHRTIYRELQGALYGADEVAALKSDLRSFINERVVVQLFEKRKGFKNGVVVQGRSIQEVERDIVEHVFGLEGYFDGKVSDHVRALEVLPRYWQYLPGLFTHGEMGEDFWRNYGKWLSTTVVSNELREFAIAKARTDLKVKLERIAETVRGYSREEILEKFNPILQKEINSLSAERIEQRLSMYGKDYVKQALGKSMLLPGANDRRRILCIVELFSLANLETDALQERLIAAREKAAITPRAEAFYKKHIETMQAAVQSVIEWRLVLLGGGRFRERLTNLYALDIVRTTMKALLLNDPHARNFDPFQESDRKANELALAVVKDQNRTDPPSLHVGVDGLKRWLKLAIGGGVIDRNNPAISAEYKSDPSTFVETSFRNALDKPLAHSLFDEDFKDFYGSVIENAPAVNLVYFLDNNGEAVFDLAFIQKLMVANKNLRVTIVPKGIKVSNDASFSDVKSILEDLDTYEIFADLKKFLNGVGAKKRLTIIEQGPTIQGVDLPLMSNELADALEPRPGERTVCFFCGQANFETTQGLHLDRYYKLIAKGVHLQHVSGFIKEDKAFIFAHLPAGAVVGTGPSTVKLAAATRTGSKAPAKTEHIWTVRQTIRDFEEAVHSEEFMDLKRRKGAFDTNDAVEKIMAQASAEGRTFAEVVFGYDVPLYESLRTMGVVPYLPQRERRQAIEEALWERASEENGEFAKGQFRIDVERLAGIDDLVSAQRVFTGKEKDDNLAAANKAIAEDRARRYLAAVALRTARALAEEGEGRQWKDAAADQAFFNRLFGVSPIVAVAGRGSRYSRHVHKALVDAGQGDTNVRLAVNGSYRSPGAVPVIYLSWHQLRYLIREDCSFPRTEEEVDEAERGKTPRGWKEGVVPEDRIDPVKKAKYFPADALIIVGQPYGTGYDLTVAMRKLREMGQEVLAETAFKQIVFGEMATAQDQGKSNASLITYMEAVIGDRLITAGGKKAERMKDGSFSLKGKGNFFLRNGKLVALTDWSKITDPAARDKLLDLGNQLKDWNTLPAAVRSQMQSDFAINDAGDVLINSNTAVFRNDIVDYLDEFTDREKHPTYWMADPKTGLPLSLAWDLIDLATQGLDTDMSAEAWPIGLVDVGNAPSSIKDIARQDKFTRSYKKALLEALKSLKVTCAKDLDIFLTLDRDARFAIWHDLQELFAGEEGAKASLAGEVRLHVTDRIGPEAKVANSALLEKVTIGSKAVVKKAYLDAGVSVADGVTVEQTVVPAGRKVTRNLRGRLMDEEIGLAERLRALRGIRIEIVDALFSTPDGLTSLAAALATILGDDAGTNKVVSFLTRLGEKRPGQYELLMRKIADISPYVPDMQIEVIDLFELVRKNASEKVVDLTMEIAKEAIDSRAIKIGGTWLYSQLAGDDWTKQQEKSFAFIEKQIEAREGSAVKKHYTLIESVEKFPMDGAKILALYNLIELDDPAVANLKDVKRMATYLGRHGLRSPDKATADERERYVVSSSLISALVGKEAGRALTAAYRTDETAAIGELEKMLTEVLDDNGIYRQLLDVFGGKRDALNSYIDHITQRTGFSFWEVIWADRNPVDAPGQATMAQASAEEWPNIVGIMGGSGGVATLLMENLLPELIGAGINMAVIVTPHDDGGSSRVAQAQMVDTYGYTPSPGDMINALSLMFKKEGDENEYKRAVVRGRFAKGETFEKMAAEKGIAAGEMYRFSPWAKKFLEEKTQELIVNNYGSAPIDWIHFIRYVIRVAEVLDREAVEKGRLKIPGGTVGNFLSIGHHIREGAYSDDGRVVSTLFDKSMASFARDLGLRKGCVFPSSLDAATLYVKLEALDCIVSGRSMQLRPGPGRLDVRAPGVKAGLHPDNTIAATLGDTPVSVRLQKDGKQHLTIGSMTASVREAFGDVITPEESETYVTVPWDPSRDGRFTVDQGKYIFYAYAKDGPPLYRVDEKVVVEGEAGDPKPNRKEGRSYYIGDKNAVEKNWAGKRVKGVVQKIEYKPKTRKWAVTYHVPRLVDAPLEAKIDYPLDAPARSDKRAAVVKLVTEGESGPSLDIKLDTKGQGTTLEDASGTRALFKGRLVKEQTWITESLHTAKVVEVGFLDNKAVDADAKARELIRNAQDAIVLGPGSFVTSLLPVFMCKGIVDELIERRAAGVPVILIANPYLDNETSEATITHMMKILLEAVNRARPADDQLKLNDILSHIVVNDPSNLSEDQRKRFFYELDEEKIAKLMLETRDASDFAGAAKKSRGPLTIDSKEITNISAQGVTVMSESMATVVKREVRTAGAPTTEEAVGYDNKVLGQIIERIILEYGMNRIKKLKLYQDILEAYYDKNEELLDDDIRRLVNDSDWLYTEEAIVRTPLEVLKEIEMKRTRIKDAYITLSSKKAAAPGIIVSNAAHTLLEYHHPSPDQPLTRGNMDPVQEISASLVQNVEKYLEAGGLLLVTTALSVQELEKKLTDKISPGLRRNIILLPYGGAQVWRFDANGAIECDPLIDYAPLISVAQAASWKAICDQAMEVFELDRPLYDPATPKMIDRPVEQTVRHTLCGTKHLLINFEMDGRRNLSDQAAAAINAKLEDKGVSVRLEKTGAIIDERAAVIAYLTEAFGKEGLPLVAEPGGTGAINTRLAAVDRNRVILETLRLLNKERIVTGHAVFSQEDIIVMGKGNEPILKALPESTGVYFREEATRTVPDNARIYAHAYGTAGVEHFFKHLNYSAIAKKTRVPANSQSEREALAKTAAKLFPAGKSQRSFGASTNRVTTASGKVATTDAALLGFLKARIPYHGAVFQGLVERLAEHPNGTFCVAIDMDIGAETAATMMPLYAALDLLERTVNADGKTRLIVKRASGRQLAQTIRDMAAQGDVDLARTAIVARYENVKGKVFDGLAGGKKAVITAIDDSKAGRGSYLPVYEGATLALLALTGADTAALVEFYNALAEEPIEDPKAFDAMRKRGVLYLLPKMAKFNLDDLATLYSLAIQASIAA